MNTKIGKRAFCFLYIMYNEKRLCLSHAKLGRLQNNEYN